MGFSITDIPTLEQLLSESSWQATPELSSIFEVGDVFRVDDSGAHVLVHESCFDGPEVPDTYTQTELTSQLQAGVGFRIGFLGVRSSVDIVKKTKFGTPEHWSVAETDMDPSLSCVADLTAMDQEDLESSYVVREVLTAQVAEQTCGKIDAKGRFVALSQAEIGVEYYQACMQESLEPVAVGYRIVGADQFLDDYMQDQGRELQVAIESKQKQAKQQWDVLLQKALVAHQGVVVELEDFVARYNDLDIAVAAGSVRIDIAEVQEARHALGWMLLLGHGTEQDLLGAFEYFSVAAAHGHLPSQSALAMVYDLGLGIQNNKTVSKQLYVGAADKGDVLARVSRFFVPHALFDSTSGKVFSKVEKHLRRDLSADVLDSMPWIVLAAENQNPWAQTCLGYIYENAQDPLKDQEVALKWYKKAARLGYVPAQERARVLQAELDRKKQEVLERGQSQMLAILTYDAQQGNATAQYNLGKHYLMGSDILGIDKNYGEAMKWFLLAAEQGHAGAEYEASRMYGMGLGVEEDDLAERELLVRSAEHGYAEAQFILAMAFITEEEPDFVTAAVWYERAAEQDHVFAQLQLADLCRDGIGGVEKNPKLAAKWYLRAAEQGNAVGQYHIASLYETGEGVPQNLPKAKYWYALSAKQGFAPAQDKLERLG